MDQKGGAPKKVTIYDVAEEAGVSKSLVSLVLRGDAAVSVNRRAAVQTAIEKLNYRPSRNAQNLASNRTKSVGVIITDYENLSFVNVLNGLREVFDPLGYRVLVTDLHTNPKSHGDAVDALVSMDVEAIVFIVEPGSLNTEGLTVPTIMVGERENLVLGSDVVFSEDRIGTQLVIEHFIKLGHKNIAHLSGLGGIATNRRKAYIDIMQERGLPRLVFGERQETNQQGGYEATKELIASGKQCTAIYAANDYIAAGAISALAEVGKSVPGDVSIIGYDNAPISRDYAMKITTVDDMSYEIGLKAADLIIDHIENGSPKKSKRILITPKLIERSSTAKKK